MLFESTLKQDFFRSKWRKKRFKMENILFCRRQASLDSVSKWLTSVITIFILHTQEKFLEDKNLKNIMQGILWGAYFVQSTENYHEYSR